MESEVPDKYEVMRMLGEGAYGRVYKVVRKSDKKIMALKVIQLRGIYPKEQLEVAQKEIEFLKNLSKPKCDPFVICYYDSFYDQDTDKLYIEMEYVDGPEMFNFIIGYHTLSKETDPSVNDFIKYFGYEEYEETFRENGITKVRNIYVLSLKDLSEVFPSNIAAGILRDANVLRSKDYYYYILLLITKDMAKGLKYIHSKRVVHNDIKPENIIIDGQNTPRIIDFGLSCTMPKELNHCKRFGGSLHYFPPEYIYENKRYPASDMWALGVVLFAAVKRTFPYKINSVEDLKDIEATKLQTKNITLNSIVNGLLVKDMDKRLTPDKIIDMLKNVESLRPKI